MNWFKNFQMSENHQQYIKTQEIYVQDFHLPYTFFVIFFSTFIFIPFFYVLNYRHVVYGLIFLTLLIFLRTFVDGFRSKKANIYISQNVPMIDVELQGLLGNYKLHGRVILTVFAKKFFFLYPSSLFWMFSPKESLKFSKKVAPSLYFLYYFILFPIEIYMSVLRSIFVILLMITNPNLRQKEICFIFYDVPSDKYGVIKAVTISFININEKIMLTSLINGIPIKEV